MTIKSPRVSVRRGRNPDRPLDLLPSVQLIRAVLPGAGDSHPAGATPVALPPGPNSLVKRGIRMLLREPFAGTTGQTIPGIPGHLQALFPQFTCINRRGELGVFLAVFRLTSEGSLVRTQLRPPGGLHVSVGPIFTFWSDILACRLAWRAVVVLRALRVWAVGWRAGRLVRGRAGLPLLLVPVAAGPVPWVLSAGMVPCAALPMAARRRAWRGSCGGGAGFLAGARRLRGGRFPGGGRRRRR